MGTVRNPDLQDCINYMKSQIKQMKKYPTSYEFNIPYYEKTVEYLETRGTTDGNCATCVKGEWIEKEDHNMDTYYDCSVCGNSWCTLDGTPWQNRMNFCPNCGADMRKEGDPK